MNLLNVWRKSLMAGNCRGFSLFELMVVMIILGIMAGTATPVIGRVFDSLKFRQQLGKYTAIMRYAKLVAVSRGGVVSLKLAEGDECVFELTGPLEESRNCDLGEEDVLTMDPGEIFFYPEGTSSHVLLTFAKGTRIKKIRLDMLTSKPIVE